MRAEADFDACLFFAFFWWGRRVHKWAKHGRGFVETVLWTVEVPVQICLEVESAMSGMSTQVSVAPGEPHKRQVLALRLTNEGGHAQNGRIFMEHGGSHQ